MKEKTKCECCHRESMIQMGLPVGNLTESGKIEFTEDNESQSIQMTAPLCCFHAPMVERDMIIWLRSGNGHGIYYPKDELWIDLLEKSSEELKERLDEIHNTKGWEKDKELGKEEGFVFSVYNGKNFHKVQELQKKYGMDEWFEALKKVKKVDDLLEMESFLIQQSPNAPKKSEVKE